MKGFSGEFIPNCGDINTQTPPPLRGRLGGGVLPLALWL
ncbi:MAG: hypothetical protein RLY97_1286 [Pseudomonadota bacterium]